MPCRSSKLSNSQSPPSWPKVVSDAARRHFGRIDAQAGRYFNNSEDDSRRAVCFIGSDVADKLFPTADPLGKTIRIDGRPYEVIGVGKALGSAFGQPRDMNVSVPLQTFLAAYGSRRSLGISVTSSGPDTYLDAIDEATVVMRTRRKLPPGEKDNFGIITPKAINELTSNTWIMVMERSRSDDREWCTPDDPSRRK